MSELFVALEDALNSLQIIREEVKDNQQLSRWAVAVRLKLQEHGFDIVAREPQPHAELRAIQADLLRVAKEADK